MDAIATERAPRLAPTRRDRWSPGAGAVIGAVVAVAAAVVRPDLQGAAVGVLVIAIAVVTARAGPVRGIVLAVAGVAGALLAAWSAPTDDRPSIGTLLGVAVLLPVVAVTVDALWRQRRRRDERLIVLHRALRGVTASGDLGLTLGVVAGTLRDTIGASAAAIFVDGAPDRAPAAGHAPGTPEPLARREIALGDGSPIAYALHRNERVVVPDILGSRRRFSTWLRDRADELSATGVTTIAAVPLSLSGGSIGVLAVGAANGRVLTPDTLALLAEFTDQAADVVVRAQAYEREHVVAEQLAMDDRAKSEFLATVSHEVRTPLTAAKGFVDTVLLHWHRLPDERRRELLLKASANAHDLDRLVGQLLDFARLDADHLDVTPETLVLREQVVAALHRLRPTLARHRVAVRVPVELVVTADVNGIAHVLENLLANAAKFSPADSQIIVSAREHDGEVVVTVADDGVGIAPEEQERIWERFYQSDSIEMSRRGTGIGLAIVKRFVEVQGGRSWVESTPGRGARFSFTLPRAAPDVERTVPA